MNWCRAHHEMYYKEPQSGAERRSANFTLCTLYMNKHVNQIQRVSDLFHTSSPL